jgi:acetolactate synthase-1/2/3 large subunit
MSKDTGKRQAVNGASLLLETIRNFGVDYVFMNMGIDLVSISDAFAKFEADGVDSPKPILVPHEFVAVSAAHGYYLGTGRTQAVLVYSIPGLANAHGAIVNAFKARVPLLLISGRTPLTEKGPFARDLFIDWAQESHDLGGLVREHAKWDYTVPTSENISPAVGRAFKVANSTPHGPVYLILPREVISKEIEEPRIVQPDKFSAAAESVPDDTVVKRIAKLLVEAKYPLLIASRLGRNPPAVSLLVKLAEAVASPVIEFPKLYMNFPSTHPLHLGYDPSLLLPKADVILVVESDAPWIPKVTQPSSGATVIHLDEEPSYPDYPYWGFGIDISAKGSIVPTLNRLLREVSELTKHEAGAHKQERLRTFTQMHDEQRRVTRTTVETLSTRKPVSKSWVSAQLQVVKDPNTIVVNEYDLNPAIVDFDQPGTYFSESPAGCLGGGLGMALGLKMAKPNADIVACVGEGSYIFGNPIAAHWVSAAYHFPFLTVVFDDHAYSSVKQELLTLHPNGAAARTGKYPGLELHHKIDFRKYVEAVGGIGLKVEEPAELAGTLRTALNHVRSGTQAVVDVICAP